MDKFKKSDIIASLITGEVMGLLLLLNINKYEALDLLIPVSKFLPFIFPILAVFGLYLTYLMSHKIKALYQVGRFGLIGSMNTLVDFTALNLLMNAMNIYSGKWIIIFNAIGFSVAVINSYFWNKYWTFRDRDNADIKEFSQFIAITLIGLAINSAIVFAITTLIDPMFSLDKKVWANVAKLAATGLALFWNFAGYKFIVFKKK